MIFTEYNPIEQAVIIRPSGAFNFQLFTEFQEVCKTETRGNKFHIDLSEIEYIDSSFMGMMIQMVQNNPHKTVVVINCNPDVLRSMKNAHMDNFMHVENLDRI